MGLHSGLLYAVCMHTSSAVGHHSKLTAHVNHLLEESWTLPHHKPLICKQKYRHKSSADYHVPLLRR